MSKEESDENRGDQISLYSVSEVSPRLLPDLPLADPFPVSLLSHLPGLSLHLPWLLYNSAVMVQSLLSSCKDI